MTMHVLALDVELRFPSSHSLKQKRACLRPILAGLRNRFEVSVAETDHQNTWQRCALGIALVSGEARTVEHLADQIERFLWQMADTEVGSIERHWLESDS
jgi:uncharacterized protein YlxP (DUF503 family)